MLDLFLGEPSPHSSMLTYINNYTGLKLVNLCFANKRDHPLDNLLASCATRKLAIWRRELRHFMAFKLWRELTVTILPPLQVLETDIDTLPDQEASPAGRMTVENGSLDGEMEDQGMRTREELMEELFPQSIEGEAGTESWRGAYRSPNLEHNTDSLDR